MANFIPAVNQLVSSLALGGQIIVAVLLLAVVLRGKDNGSVEFVEKHAIKLIFAISLGAVLVSLFYSSVAGFDPCFLCWWQRIFMYSICVISGLAVFKKDDSILDYLITLALFGGLIALYHVYLEYGGVAIIPCSADAAASCTQRFIYEYNYITIPVMSLTGFAMIGTILGIKKANG